MRIKSFSAWPRELGLFACTVHCVLVMPFLVDVVRLLDCGKICSVCYARLARVLVALSLCLEKKKSAGPFVVLVLVALNDLCSRVGCVYID